MKHYQHCWSLVQVPSATYGLDGLYEKLPWTLTGSLGPQPFLTTSHSSAQRPSLSRSDGMHPSFVVEKAAVTKEHPTRRASLLRNETATYSVRIAASYRRASVCSSGLLRYGMTFLHQHCELPGTIVMHLFIWRIHTPTTRSFLWLGFEPKGKLFL